MVLGDDDGLLDNMVERAFNTLTKSHSPALIWQKASYTWPNIKKNPNEISFFLMNKAYSISVRHLLFIISMGLASYGRIPSLYSGFISVDIIKKIKSKHGTFFHSETPDIYSGLAIMSKIDRYIYSYIPYSVSGASAKSNGYALSTKNKNKLMNLYFNEMDISQHSEMKIIPGSVTSQLLECLLQANEKYFEGSLKIWKKKFYEKIVKELSVRDHDIYENGIDVLKRLDLKRSELKQINRFIEKYPNVPPNSKSKSRDVPFEICLNGSDFDISNINDACKFISKIIPDNYYNNSIKKFTFIEFLGLILSRLKG